MKLAFPRQASLRLFSSYAYKQTKAYQKSSLVDRVVRVDHAGEFGADRIYAGQFLVLKQHSISSVIKEMWIQEQEHLASFEQFIIKYRARPSALLPFWNVAGFLLGSGTALLGISPAMACTVGVEKVITNHYNNQIRKLMEVDEGNKELLSTLRKYRDDEQHHHDTGLQYNAAQTPFFKYYLQVIEAGCIVAVWLAERV